MNMFDQIINRNKGGRPRKKPALTKEERQAAARANLERLKELAKKACQFCEDKK